MSKFDSFTWYDSIRYIINSNGYNIEIVSYYGKFEVLIRRGDLLSIEKYYISDKENYNDRIYRKNKKFFLKPKKSGLWGFKYSRDNSFFTIKYINDYGAFVYGDLLSFGFNRKHYLGYFDKLNIKSYSNSFTMDSTQDYDGLHTLDLKLNQIKTPEEVNKIRWKRHQRLKPKTQRSIYLRNKELYGLSTNS